MAAKLIVQEPERYSLTVVDGTQLTIQVGAPAGPSGPTGSDATVTNASVNAAISTNTSATKIALGIISADITDAVSDSSLPENFEKLIKSNADGQLTLGEVFASEVTVGTGGGNGTIWILGGDNPSGITNTNGANGVLCALPTTSGTFVVSGNTDGLLTASDLGLGSIAFLDNDGTASILADGVGTNILSANSATLQDVTVEMTLTLTNALAVDNGGTGSATAAGALTNLGAQASLVSGTNIKTINSSSLLGAGNLAIAEANATNVAAVIAGATEKTTPVDADQLGITDSAASGALKRLTFANLWAWVKSKLDTALTIAGTKTFSGQMELTGQAATNATSAMTRAMVDESAFLTPNINCYYPYSAGTAGGASVSVTNGQYAIANLGANAASYARVGLASYWQTSNLAGSTMRFDRPFRMRFSHLCNMNYSDANGPICARIYIGSNGSFTIPNAGADPYPVNTRGIGIEWRKKVGSYQVEIRLFARNGTSSVAGTFIATSWTDIGASANSNGRAHDFYLVFDNTTGTVRLFAAAWDAGGASNPPQRHSATPLLTLSGTGVPTDNQHVATNWAITEAVVIGDGVAVPTPTSTYNMFRQTIIMQG